MRVAIVDSGVDAGHPLVGAVAGAVAFDADGRDIRRIDGPHDDLYGHGTACAGIIRSLAPGVQLWSVRVLGARLTTGGSVFAAGLEWCIDNGMHVVNLSLSTSAEQYFDVFHDLVDRAAHAGIALVAAMNNIRKATYPSQFAGVLSVAASRGTDPEVFWRNPRPPAEWGAPGFDRRVAWLGGGHATVTGNSFAAPVIAGHVARLVGAHPGLAPWEVKAILGALPSNASGICGCVMLSTVEFALLADLSAEEQREVLASARRRRYRSGEMLFHEGDAGESFHLVTNGTVLIRLSTPLGDVASVALLVPGDGFGEQALLSADALRTASAQAIGAWRR